MANEPPVGTNITKRKYRYHTDPEYRAQALKRSAEYRERKRQERLANQKPPTLTIDGKEVPAVTVHDLLEEVGISKGRFKYFQRVRFIPKALVTHPVRLYTQNQVSLVAQLDEFLAANGKYLKVPDSEIGMETQTSLNHLVSTIAANWEN